MEKSSITSLTLKKGIDQRIGRSMRLRAYALQLCYHHCVSQAESCICKDNHAVSLRVDRLPDSTYFREPEVTDAMAFSFHLPAILSQITR